MREEPVVVAVDALRDELMSVPGVASAEVDLTDANAPAGVRVRLTADADARRVGAEVQRVLATHGMRSRFSEVPGGAAPPAEPPPVPITAPPGGVAEDPVVPPPPPESPPTSHDPDPEPVPVRMAAVPAPPEEPSPAPPGVTAQAPESPPQRVIRGGLDSVAMEERADGLAVRVTLDDGRVGSHDLTGDTPEERDAAVIAAVAAAVGVDATAVGTEWMEVDGASIVTVVLRLDDDAVVAGAGVVRVGRAFALGMATRAALSL